MAFPKTLDDMRSGGYVLSSHGVCRSCKREIEWWVTPNGKKIPMDLMDRGTDEAKSHFATCPDAGSFRKDE